jgi:hypothetical protein
MKMIYQKKIRMFGRFGRQKLGDITRFGVRRCQVRILLKIIRKLWRS